MAKKGREKPVDVARENMGFGSPVTRSSAIPPLLHDPAQREAYGLPKEDDVPGPYMIELNLDYRGGWKEAKEAFEAFYKQVLGPAAEKRPADVVSKNYFRCQISVNEWRELVRADEAHGAKPERLIYKIWPDFKLKPLIDRSIATVKADAALRAYSATGAGIVWAVIDSGIDKRHLHFAC